ncbi:MAG: transporter, family, shikimate and dehydroshikimate transport protein, partial [Streptomycetaceae bacterium]|nr:transporter, family, shikimate and dehydroshikimate transport protein [Streptomycetaceae bacterium]
AVPFFLLMQTGSVWGYVVGMTLGLGLGLGHGAMYGAQGALFSNLYPVNVRYTGLSVTQQIGATLGGGLSPLIGAALLTAGHGRWGWPAVYCVAVALVSSLAASRLRNGERQPDPSAPQEHAVSSRPSERTSAP